MLPGQDPVEIEETSFYLTPPFDNMMNGGDFCREYLGGDDYRVLLQECFNKSCSFGEITRLALERYANAIREEIGCLKG